MTEPQDPPEIRLQKPLAVDRESKRGPSLALSTVFAVGMTMLVVPLAGFILSIAIGWQTGLDLSTKGLKLGLCLVGALLAYGFAVGVYHTILAMTGLDRRR